MKNALARQSGAVKTQLRGKLAKGNTQLSAEDAAVGKSGRVKNAVVTKIGPGETQL